jgi:hypothetical protein
MTERIFKGFDGDLVMNDAGVTFRRRAKGILSQGLVRGDKFIPWATGYRNPEVPRCPVHGSIAYPQRGPLFRPQVSPRFCRFPLFLLSNPLASRGGFCCAIRVAENFRARQSRQDPRGGERRQLWVGLPPLGRDF